MTNAIGPMLYTDEGGNPAAIEVSEILTIGRVDDPRRPAASYISTKYGLPIGAMDSVPELFRRWVEVLSFSVPRDPANFPGYAETRPENQP